MGAELILAARFSAVVGMGPEAYFAVDLDWSGELLLRGAERESISMSSPAEEESDP